MAQMLGGNKNPEEEQVTIAFAFATCSNTIH
jgi:hypothetical protein